MSSSRPPAGVTEHEWRKFQAKKMRADMKAVVGTSTIAAASSSPSITNNAGLGSSMDSAALQADMSRRYNLGGVAPRRPRRQHSILRRAAGGGADSSHVSSQAKQSESQTSAVAILRLQDRQQKRAYKAYEEAQQPSSSSSRSRSMQSRQHQAFTTAPKEPSLPEQYCDSCDSENRGEDAVCTVCGYFMAGAPMPAPQTLAQRRGLAPPSAPRARAITPLEWNSMETALKKRDDAYCPICMEGFSHGSEVLLSCSHMFHRACLTAFEKFMAKDTRACPICRTSDYQKRITTVGSASYHKVCILKIQVLYRGYVARKEFRVKLRGFYRNSSSNNTGSKRVGAGGEIARRNFFEKELSSLGHEMEMQTNARVRGLNNVVEGIDRTLDQGRDLDVLFDAMLRERTAAREAMGLTEGNEGEGEGPGGGEGIDADALPTSTDTTSAVITSGTLEGIDALDAHGKPINTPKLPVLSDREWQVVLTQARNRGLGECAICMAPNKGLRNICMLSCSHIFHSQCIANFEKFIIMSGAEQSTKRGCPICRSNFIARPLATGGSEWGLGQGQGHGLVAPLSLSH